MGPVPKKGFRGISSFYYQFFFRNKVFSKFFFQKMPHMNTDEILKKIFFTNFKNLKVLTPPIFWGKEISFKFLNVIEKNFCFPSRKKIIYCQFGCIAVPINYSNVVDTTSK